MAIMRVLLRVRVGEDPIRNCRREPTIFDETERDSSYVKKDEYNDEDCRSEECIDLIECNDNQIFDINKLPIFYDNDDAIVEEKVVLVDDGHVLEVTRLTSIPQVSVVVLCDEAPSTKIHYFQDEVEEITPHIYVSPIVDGFIGEFEQDLFVFQDFMKVCHIHEKIKIQRRIFLNREV
ncbi:hypothetical protein Sjap_022788 [Stephania japonica]|uniref:Uncharacterized protein n=1 Tax=Stephania japonica TaxID=461633 RepID=A0AAP0HUQ6_9MAGN